MDESKKPPEEVAPEANSPQTDSAPAVPAINPGDVTAPTPRRRKLRVLCVDDEPFVLEGLTLNLRRHFKVVTAPSGVDALRIIEEEADNPFPIVISDMRMPGMDGATFLARVHQVSPDSVRMLLTGHTDLEAAIRAVNEGRIFRFLSKPFPAQDLVAVCEEAAEQYRLIKAEKDVLEQTLWGSVNVLTQILSMLNPGAFGRTTRILTVTRHLVTTLHLLDGWQFEVAAMLSQVGCVTLPSNTLARIDGGGPLSPKEREIYRAHPSVAADLIQNIPRLGEVADMIRHQLDAFQAEDFDPNIPEADRSLLGAQMLRLAVDLSRLSLKGHSSEEALDVIQERTSFYHPALVKALSGLSLPPPKLIPKYARVEDLVVDMVLDENVETTSGVVLVSKGNTITEEVLARLKRFGKGGGLKEPFRVVIRV